MIEFLDAKKVAGMLAAVGEPTRMLILYRLSLEPHHVGQLADILGVPMVNMSHHLGVMRQAGLLDDEKDGRRVVYRLRPEIYSTGSSPDELAVLTIGRYRLIVRRGEDRPRLRIRPRSRLRRKVANRAPAPPTSETPPSFEATE